MRRVWQNRRDGTGYCKGCPGCDSPYPLGGLGSENADVMLIAQEPAYNVDNDELVDGAPEQMDWQVAKKFMMENRRESMNPLWRHLMNVALAARCSPEDLYFTNLAKCASGDWDERVDHCSGYIPYEIGVVQPKIILLHGGKVLTEIMDTLDIEWSGRVGDVHGEMFETSSLTLVCLYHWGYAHRNGTIEEYNDTVSESVQGAI